MTTIKIPTGNGYASVYKYDNNGDLISHSLVRKKMSIRK
jgi:hypothetical protein